MIFMDKEKIMTINEILKMDKKINKKMSMKSLLDNKKKRKLCLWNRLEKMEE